MAETTEQPAPAASETIVKETPAPNTEVKVIKEPVTKDVEDKAATKIEPKKAATILESMDEVKTVAPADFPDDWREKMSGGDEKLLKRLQRMKSPVDVANWGKNVEKQWKQGADSDPFPSEGTDEEKAAWRKGKSIPDKPADYIKDFSLPDGLVIGENDKPLVNDYLNTAHQMNLSPEVVKNNIGWYFKMRDQEIQKRMEKDEEDKSAIAKELRAEYGGDFKKYLGAADELLESAPDGVMEALAESRTRDGRKLVYTPQIVRWLSQLALDVNPAATTIPGRGSDAMASVDTRMSEIEEVMKTDRNKYYRTGLDKEYQKLVEIKEKANKRKAA